MAIISGEEEKLIAGLKKKNEEAFETLMSLYGDRVLKLCYLILKEQIIAEDITQEVFIQIYKSIEKFKGECSLYTWIYKITMNKCRTALKRKKEFVSIEENIEVQADIDIEAEVLNTFNREKIKEAVLSLPPGYREVIILFYFEELSVKEIAEILEEKENTVKSKLYRGRNILKENIEREDG